MAHVYLGDFLVNSAGFALYVAGVMKRTVTDQDIPASIPVRLKTNTFEDIFPALFAKYPDKMMSIDINAPKSPSAQLLEGKMVESVVVDLGFNVIVSPGQTTRVFALSMAADAEVRVRAEGAAIKGHADVTKIAIAMKESSIGPIDVEACKPLFEMVVNQMVVPKVNAKLEKGISLPGVSGVYFVRPSIAVKAGYIVLDADIEMRAKAMLPFDFEVEQALMEDEADVIDMDAVDEVGEDYVELSDNLMETDVELEKDAAKPACGMDECEEFFGWCTKESCNLYE